MELAAISTPEELAKAIDGRTDQEITDTFQAIGIDEALDRVFRGMEQAFLPERAKDEKTVIEWQINTPAGPRTYHVTVDAGTCSAHRGSGPSPRVTLMLAIPDFLRLVTGKLAGPQAFFQGKLKLSGDVLFAQAQQSWFRIASN